MATNLLDLTAEIVSAHASVTEMTSDDLLKELKMVYAMLQALEKGEKPVTIEISVKEPKKRSKKTQEPAEPVAEKAEEKPAIPPAPAMTILEAFKPDQVACMICGKTGMKTLKRHLASAHNLKPGQYRKQFNIPKDQPLAATEYVAKRRQAALDRGLGAKLVAARAAKKAKQAGE
ncbi:MAG: MucR family transcriptional regulator [Candidatus Atribacteria bacterium]|nr:MAG: MucR family transcriptional regulator [Candidatus Atribacteria bacterium]